MELRVLRYFLTVAREQTISGAAQSLHLSQPTLSRQILDLEEELGVTLFIRGNRKITLTEEGMLLRKRAEQIVDLVRKTEEDLGAADDAVRGTIYIGAGESHAFRTVASSIVNLLAEQTGVRIDIFSGNAEDVTERLDKGLLDFGLLIEPTDVTNYDYIRLPIADRWGLIMRKDSPLAALEAIGPDDVRDVPVLCSRRVLKGGQLSSWLQTDPEKLNLVATYNLIFNATLLVEEGLGYAFSLEHLVETMGSGKLCFRPLKPALESQVHLVWKKYQVFSKPSELFLQKIRAALGG